MGNLKLYGFSFSEIAGALIIGVLFLLASYLSVEYMDFLRDTVGTYGYWGMSIYVLIAIFATVFAPVSATPLIPVAATVWGPLVVGLLNLVAWTLGSVIAFLIARKYGYEVVGKFAKLKKIQRYVETIPEKRLFPTVILVRLLVPADILSYALGLFSKMRLTPYTIATLIGIAPFAFILPYAVTFPLEFQLLGLLILVFALFFTYRKYQLFSADTEEGHIHDNIHRR